MTDASRSNPRDTPPDPAIVLDLLEAFRRSQTLFAALDLGVFDALQQRPDTFGGLAERLAADADALERLLDACVGLVLLAKHDGVYANTPLATAYLTSTSPRRMTGYLHYSRDVSWRLWEHLADAVREGTHRWKQVYGWDGPIFSHFFKTEESQHEFLMGMHGFGLISSPVVVGCFDLGEFQHLVDLGAATGHLAIAACEAYPSLRATVFDLPDVLPLARRIVHESSVADRIELVPGDFFKDPLPSGDLYTLGRIVHDWSEDKILRLLRRIHDHLPAGGALLIAEKVLLPDKTGPRWAQMQNLNMLTCTEGKERTLAEYQAILTQVGFRDVTCRSTDAPLDAVLARK
jgi:acetylserotonin N-methyltransferase